ncbi:5471_t:CDS:2 [Scutellospora calospora]|uniref:5471_t:CDS:1 n=1 Tax=Scutellospora calospora TaxID=85575 RepID=A0ACA9M6Q0_9GLOM|nr:5471_t:CDS:2 [Scutellospora calospora]
MEEFVINNNMLYKLAVNHNALYDNNQPKNKSNDAINFEGANYENTIDQEWSYIVDDHAMNEIEKYGKKQGFKTCCYYVEKSNNCIQRCMLVCEHYRKPEATKSKDLKKETTSKCIGCTWQINLLCSEKNNPHKIVYITKLVDEYMNYDLDHEL